MKRIIALLLSASLILATACQSAPAQEAHTPVYGEPLILADNLEFEDIYVESVSPENLEEIKGYLSYFAIFYNSIDPSSPQGVDYSNFLYMIYENYLSTMTEFTAPLLEMQENSIELNEAQQAFLDLFHVSSDLTIKLNEIDSDAYQVALNDYINEVVAQQSTEEGDETVEGEEDEEGEVTQNEISLDDLTTMTLDAAEWEVLFNMIVEQYDMVFKTPFVKAPQEEGITDDDTVQEEDEVEESAELETEEDVVEESTELETEEETDSE